MRSYVAYRIDRGVGKHWLTLGSGKSIAVSLITCDAFARGLRLVRIRDIKTKHGWEFRFAMPKADGLYERVIYCYRCLPANERRARGRTRVPGSGRKGSAPLMVGAEGRQVL